MLMSVQLSEHDMNKFDITISDKIIASYYMPTAMSIMAFTTFSNINRGFHLKLNCKFRFE